MDLIKPITSDHDLIKLAMKLNVHLDHIFESNEIKAPLPKKGSFLILLRKPNQDVGHWSAVYNHEYYDSMGEGPPKEYGISKYNEIQTQSAHGSYCGVWALLWLYAKQHNRMDLFKKFKDLNIIVAY
ncbi:hypothetical protein ON010_g4779 [Phytophthora cinnamomi]|nr:hypothetical protein ON010_g4779 [Phytophthora cinnamomi]